MTIEKSVVAILRYGQLEPGPGVYTNQGRRYILASKVYTMKKRYHMNLTLEEFVATLRGNHRIIMETWNEEIWLAAA